MPRSFAALVIGNSKYKKAGKLKNTANDDADNNPETMYIYSIPNAEFEMYILSRILRGNLGRLPQNRRAISAGALSAGALSAGLGLGFLRLRRGGEHSLYHPIARTCYFGFLSFCIWCLVHAVLQH